MYNFVHMIPDPTEDEFVIFIYEPWVDFYIHKHKHYKYKMTKPTEE